MGHGETVLFSLDGVAYEIDLSEDHASELRDALTRFIAGGRAVSSARAASGQAGSRRPRRRSGQEDYGQVRAWAKENGYQVSERGRVPATVLEAFRAAH